jgi:hypothetical protein
MLEGEPNDFLFQCKSRRGLHSSRSLPGVSVLASHSSYGYFCWRFRVMERRVEGVRQPEWCSVHQNHAIVVSAAFDGVKTHPAQEAPGHPGPWSRSGREVVNDNGKTVPRLL